MNQTIKIMNSILKAVLFHLLKHINAKKTPLFPEIIYFEEKDEKYDA